MEVSQQQALKEFNLKVKQIAILKTYKTKNDVNLEKDNRLEQFVNNIIARNLGFSLPDSFIPQKMLTIEKNVSKTIQMARSIA